MELLPHYDRCVVEGMTSLTAEYLLLAPPPQSQRWNIILIKKSSTSPLIHSCLPSVSVRLVCSSSASYLEREIQTGLCNLEGIY